MKKKRILTWINKNRIIKFVSEIPEALFAIALIFVVLALLYFFEKPEGFVHSQFPGLILDISVFGILIVVFNRINEKRCKIRNYRDEILDYLPWKEPEATYRIVGIIKRLNRLGVSNINLCRANLQEADLQGANLQDADLFKANLHETDLSFANLQKADLGRANLQEAGLSGANLKKANLFRANLQEAGLFKANLQEADLIEANLQEADLQGANLQNADLRGANLQGVKKITIEQISKAKTLYGVVNLDELLLSQIKENYPHLLEKVEDEK